MILVANVDDDDGGLVFDLLALGCAAITETKGFLLQVAVKKGNETYCPISL